MQRTNLSQVPGYHVQSSLGRGMGSASEIWRDERESEGGSCCGSTRRLSAIWLRKKKTFRAHRHFLLLAVQPRCCCRVEWESRSHRRRVDGTKLSKLDPKSNGWKKIITIIWFAIYSEQRTAEPTCEHFKFSRVECRRPTLTRGAMFRLIKSSFLLFSSARWLFVS